MNKKRTAAKNIKIFFMILTGIMLLAGPVYGKAGFKGQKYPYNESDQSQVTVNVTISNDGLPIRSESGSVLSHIKVTVPYFDLGLYGLKDFYRYPTDETCDYIKEEGVIKRPTLLHLYIYMLERYYLGYPETKCGLGYGKEDIFQKERTDSVDYISGETAYFTFDGSTGTGRKLLQLSGASTSLYMQNFWGHDENLNYYVNHEYPVMWTDWGASADYILLEDGDAVDVAMFTDYGFYQKGGFPFFGEDDFHLSEGETLKTKTYNQKGSMQDDSGNFYTPDPEETQNLTVRLYDENWHLVKNLDYDSEGYISCSFEKAGIWYLTAEEKEMAGKNGAALAPATAKVTVSENGSALSVKSLKLSAKGNKSELMAGESLQLETDILPVSAALKSVRWKVEGSAGYVDYQGIFHAKDYLEKDQQITITASAKANRFAEDSIQLLVKADQEVVKKVRNVENLIDAIGSSERDIEYTQECNNKILAARKAYDDLGKGTVAYRNVDSKKVEFLESAELVYKKLKENAEKISPTPKPTQSPVPTKEPVKIPVSKPEEKPAAVQTPKTQNTPKIATPKILSVKKIKKGVLNIKWKKASKVSGYELQMSRKKKSGFKKISTMKAKKAVYRKAGLKKGKTYYFRIRSFRVIKGKKYYSAWSKVVRGKS